MIIQIKTSQKIMS